MLFRSASWWLLSPRMMGARAALRRFAEGEPMAGFAFLSENVSILAWILSLRFYIVAFKLLRITIVPEGLLANSLIAAWGCWRFFRYFFRHCKGVFCPTFPRASKKRAAWCPLGAVKACAAWRSSERRRNAGRTPHRQMLDAVRRRLSNPYLL